jgi:VanZ family protein
MLTTLCISRDLSVNLSAISQGQLTVQSPLPTSYILQNRKVLGAICGIIVCCILIAGLWPFRAPVNRVTWLADGDGLHFGRQGSILSSGEFGNRSYIDDRGGTVEIWLRADSLNSSGGTILAFYTTAKRFVPFSLRQFKDSLVLQHEVEDRRSHLTTKWMGVGHVLRQKEFVLVTITSGARGTTVYADGLAIEGSSGFRLPSNDFSGRLLLGNSGVDDDSWAGDVRGLAIYGQGLTSAQVSRHFEDWTKHGHPEDIATEAASALYLFNERSGSVVHNQSDAANALLIPSHYFLLHHRLLRTPWEAYRRRWSYWKDAAVNVTGFVPLGFFICAYFSLAKKQGRGVATAIIIGFLISLTIELLQSLLPTRDSGATDLITNTLGTGLGAICCQYVLGSRVRHVPLDGAKI